MFTFSFLLAVVSFSATAHDTGRVYCSDLLRAPQRQMAMAAELIKLMPPEPQAVHAADPTDQVRELSQANLKRLLSVIDVSQVAAGELDQKKIEGMVSKLDFVALRRLTQLVERKLEPETDFYSALTGGAKSVGFVWVASSKGSTLQNLTGHVGSDSARLEREFGDQNALVVPHFTSADEMIDFFRQWDPEALDALAKMNRYNVPTSAWQTEAFLDYVKKSGATSQLFPWGQLYTRLGPLRQRLHRFLLTPQDARTFASAIMTYFMNHKISSGNLTVEQLQEMFGNMGGPGRLFQIALRDIGWPGMALQVPNHVPASRISIVRLVETYTMALPDHSRRAQPRRLDHKNMP